MNEQGSLFGGLTGHDHPATSFEAAATPLRLAGWRAAVLRAFLAAPDGLTAAEAGAIVGLNTNIAGARFLELRGDRRVPPTPALIRRTEERRAVPGGRPGYVHVLTEEGRRRASALPPGG